MSNPALLGFRPQRISVLAGIAYSVVPPVCCSVLEIVNATSDDISVVDVADPTPATPTHYFILGAGSMKDIRLPHPRFNSAEVAFYITPNVNGTVVLIWA